MQVKNKTTATVASFFSGVIGVDRFYPGYTGLGVLKLLTVGILWFAYRRRYFSNCPGRFINCRNPCGYEFGGRYKEVKEDIGV